MQSLRDTLNSTHAVIEWHISLLGRIFVPVHRELAISMERCHQVHGGTHTYHTAVHELFMDHREVSTCSRHGNTSFAEVLQC